MNSKPFTRDEVSRLISKNYTENDFIEEFEFRDSEDFRNALGRIFYGNEKAIQAKLRQMKSNKKIKGKSKKQEIEDIPKPSQEVTVPFNSLSSIVKAKDKKQEVKVSLNSDKTEEQTKTTVTATSELPETKNEEPIQQVEKPNTPQTPEEPQVPEEPSPIKDLTLKLDDKKTLLDELTEQIDKNVTLAAYNLEDLQKSSEKIKQLQEQLKNEQEKALEKLNVLEQLEKELEDEKKQKESLRNEVEEITKNLERLKKVKVYFGKNSDVDCDIVGTEVVIPSDAVTMKMDKIIDIIPDDLSFKQVKELVKVLCQIEVVQKENDTKQLEVIFDELNEIVKTIGNFTNVEVKIA